MNTFKRRMVGQSRVCLRGLLKMISFGVKSKKKTHTLASKNHTPFLRFPAELQVNFCVGGLLFGVRKRGIALAENGV